MSKILVITDVGSDIDDALSLLIMLNHPEINIGGIYTVNGDVNSRCYIAKRMTELANRLDVIVARGSSKPLFSEIAPYYFFEECLVDDKYVDDERMEREGGYKMFFKPLKKVGIIPNGLKNLADQLSKERCIVFSLAPMTDIALLLRHYPLEVKNIEKLFIMGSRLNGGMEHNFRFDSLAAQEILASDIPNVFIPGDLCSKYRLSPEIIQISSACGDYVMLMLNAFVGAKWIASCRVTENLIFDLNKSKIKVELMNGKNGLEKFDFKNVFLANLDEYSAFFERDIFIEQFHLLFSYIEDRKLAKKVELLKLKNISVADAFVPYCFLHPEKIQTQKCLLDCTLKGETVVNVGSKHEVVTDLDFDHFQDFLLKYLK